MSFTPVVVSTLVLVGLGLGIYFIFRAKHMISAVGDVRVIKRGDGAYLIEEMLESKYEDSSTGQRWWKHYDIIEGNEYPSDEKAFLAAQEIAVRRLEHNREQVNMVRKLQQKTVVMYGRVDE